MEYIDDEYRILEQQESLADECKGCEYSQDNGRECRNQCMETHTQMNPWIVANIAKR